MLAAAVVGAGVDKTGAQTFLTAFAIGPFESNIPGLSDLPDVSAGLSDLSVLSGFTDVSAGLSGLSGLADVSAGLSGLSGLDLSDLSGLLGVDVKAETGRDVGTATAVSGASAGPEEVAGGSCGVVDARFPSDLAGLGGGAGGALSSLGGLGSAGFLSSLGAPAGFRTFLNAPARCVSAGDVRRIRTCLKPRP